MVLQKLGLDKGGDDNLWIVFDFQNTHVDP